MSEVAKQSDSTAGKEKQAQPLDVLLMCAYEGMLVGAAAGALGRAAASAGANAGAECKKFFDGLSTGFVEAGALIVTPLPVALGAKAAEAGMRLARKQKS